MIQLLREKATSRLAATTSDLFGSNTVAKISIFRHQDGFYAIRDSVKSDFTPLALDGDAPRTDVVEIALRYFAARQQNNQSISDTFPVNCRCGRPFTLVQRIKKGGTHPFRLQCEHSDCTTEALVMHYELEQELKRWFKFESSEADTKPVEGKQIPKKVESKMSANNTDSMSASDSADAEASAPNDLKSRFKTALKEAPYRGLRMVALTEGKQALLGTLKSTLDPKIAEPIANVLESPGGEGLILAALGAAAPYATENEHMLKLGDEFLKEGTAKSLHQVVQLLAFVFQPTFAAMEEKLKSSKQIIDSVASRLDPPKKRVNTDEESKPSVTAQGVIHEELIPEANDKRTSAVAS